jgi:hypothetical protein
VSPTKGASLRGEHLHSGSSYKRLEEGTFKLPKITADQASVELKASELAMLLDGIDLASVKRTKRFGRNTARPADDANRTADQRPPRT